MHVEQNSAKNSHYAKIHTCLYAWVPHIKQQSEGLKRNPYMKFYVLISTTCNIESEQNM